MGRFVAFLKTPFKLGNIELPNNIFYSPLAGCSDYPFRKMSRKYGPGLIYCEMVKLDAIVRNDPHTYRLLDYDPSMHPIGAQLVGSKVNYARQAAKIIEDLGFDVLDFNCGCPVDKVTKDGSGSGMLKTPDIIGEMLTEMIDAVSIPVTVKIRAGWDDDSINAAEITEIAERAGAKAIAIHGRTREQGYKGPANWDHIKACKEVAKNIMVIGNGDLFDPEKVRSCFSHTGCDAALLSRGTLGQPWLAEDVIRDLMGEERIDRDVFSIRDALLTHFHEIMRYQNDIRSLLDFRRVGCWYLKRCIGAKSLRIELNRAKSAKEALTLMTSFPWETLSLAQVVEMETSQ